MLKYTNYVSHLLHCNVVKILLWFCSFGLVESNINNQQNSAGVINSIGEQVAKRALAFFHLAPLCFPQRSQFLFHSRLFSFARGAFILDQLLLFRKNMWTTCKPWENLFWSRIRWGDGCKCYWHVGPEVGLELMDFNLKWVAILTWVSLRIARIIASTVFSNSFSCVPSNIFLVSTSCDQSYQT